MPNSIFVFYWLPLDLDVTFAFTVSSLFPTLAAGGLGGRFKGEVSVLLDLIIAASWSAAG